MSFAMFDMERINISVLGPYESYLVSSECICSYFHRCIQYCSGHDGYVIFLRLLIHLGTVMRMLDRHDDRNLSVVSSHTLHDRRICN